MRNRSLKTAAYVIAGIAYFSGYVFAASDSLKPETSTGSSATAPAGKPAPAAQTPGPGAQTAPQFTDAEILGVVEAVDVHEIEAATRALKKKLSTEVTAYATMLQEHHRAGKEIVKKLGKSIKMKPADSKTASDIRTKGEAEVQAMGKKTGAEFEKAYIDAMVTGHSEVLNLIDTQLAPGAKNEAVKSHLTEFRGQVSAHLEQGKRLQGASASATEQTEQTE